MRARAAGHDLVGPLEQLSVDAVAHDQAVEPILTGPTAFFTLDPEDCELANQVAENDGAFTRPLLLLSVCAGRCEI
jgi:hypothetical protein